MSDGNNSGIGLYALRLRRTGATLSMEQALRATGLTTPEGQQRAIEGMSAQGLIEVHGDTVTVKQIERPARGPGRKPSVNGHRFNNERPGYRSDTRNGPVTTKPARDWTDSEIDELLGTGPLGDEADDDVIGEERDPLHNLVHPMDTTEESYD